MPFFLCFYLQKIMFLFAKLHLDLYKFHKEKILKLIDTVLERGGEDGDVLE